MYSFTNINHIYICIDGIAPMSKIVQQRGRRYKSVLLKNEINKIKETYDIYVDNWDSNCISLGIEFMNNLSVYLHSFTNELDYKITISDSMKKVKRTKILSYLEKKIKNVFILFMD